MLYFDTLPKIVTNDELGNPILMTNLLNRATFLEELQNNPLLYYTYSIQNGDTPEIVAHKYYEDPYKYWIVLYANQILDPLWDWPMDDSVFSQYLIEKYGTYAYTQTTVHSYEKITTTKDLISDVVTTNYNTITFEQYSALTPSTTTYNTDDPISVSVSIGKRIVYVFDYEYELNESKREIKLLNSAFVYRMEQQFKELMSQ